MGARGRRPAFPAFPQADVDLRAADRSGQGDRCGRRARADRRRLDAHGHSQLSKRRNAERLRQPHQAAPASPSVPTSSKAWIRSSTTGRHVDLVRGTPYLNPAAFATQPLSAQGVPSRLGTAPPVLDVRGPAFYSEDFGLLKRVTAGGERSVEFRVDFINALNRSGLGGPITDMSSPNFGRIFGGRDQGRGVCSCRAARSADSFRCRRERPLESRHGLHARRPDA